MALNTTTDGFVSKTDIKVNGAALPILSHPTNRVQLLGTEHSYGSAWWNRSVDLSKDWNSSFYVTAFNGSGTSDGFTFAINGDQRGIDAIGDGGQNLGFFGYDSKTGIGKSYAVLFDMWTTQPASLLGFASSATNEIPQGSLNSPVSLANNDYAVEIDYSASQKRLSVSIGGNVFTQNVDLNEIVGSNAYLGFTAANGGGSLDTDVSKWKVSATEFVPFPVVRGNSLYTIVDGPSWTQAEANSVKLGGHLAKITDQQENTFLTDAIRSQPELGLWTGMTDKDEEGVFRYAGDTSNLPTAYFNWVPSEPYDNGGEDYVMIYTGNTSDTSAYHQGKWNDVSVSFERISKGIAETPFIRRGDSAYVIVSGPTWEEAEANAVKLGGHLVTINDAAENEWIVDQWRFTNLSPDNISRAWIGYKEGTWVDGTTLNETIQRWSYNFSGGNNRFGQIDLNGPIAGQWADLENNHGAMKHGLAEIKLAPNNTPTGTPTLSGNLKPGQVISIDRIQIQDADNFTGYTPDFKYSWEVSNDGTTWTKLTSTDATDNNSTYTLTTAEVGTKVRGVVSYLDGYGTNEVVPTAGSASVTDPSPTYTLTPSATSVNEGSTISYTLTTSNVASGTSLYYQFSGTGINAADFSSATTTGSESVGSNGQMTISRTFTADKITEGNETLTLKVFTDSAATTPLATNSAVTVIDTSLTPSTPTQKVYTEKSEISYKPTGVAALPLLYTTSNNDANLSGLTLNVHYNSSILTPSGANNGVSGQVPAAITTTTILPDTSNTDGDPLTDKIVQLLWATFDNSFPNKTLPTAIATVSFDTSATKKDPVTGQPLSTTVRYTAAEAAPNYDFLTGSTTFKAQQFNLDVDGDGKVTALGDGLMVIRKLFGAAFSGDALTAKARSVSATRSTSEIHDFIQQGIDSGTLDVDMDGRTTALGDGLMVIRRLFGAAFDGGALTSKAISPESPYFGPSADFAAVAANIDALKPTLI